MSRVPAFMKEFGHIINISEILKVGEQKAIPSANVPQSLHIHFIEKGSMELPGVTVDEFWEALKNASLTLQENRRSTGSN